MARATPVARPLAEGGHASPEARIGPNAVIQLAAVLRSRHGEDAARAVFARAGLRSMLVEPPPRMVDQRAVAALWDTLFRHLPRESAMAAAAEAGARTADYVLTHRIPGPARIVLRCLPAFLAAPLLLNAIAEHAWTFVGSGRVATGSGPPGVVEIFDNPITMPGCAWHVAVFERLFRALASPRATIRHPRCCRDGAAACRFEIHMARPGSRIGA